jgi:tetratricopeptide (TPR) repeat protein
VDYYLRQFGDKVRTRYTRYYDRGQYDWDYAVYSCNYINPYQLKNGLWPPEGTIHTIDVNGIPVCAVVKRTSKEDYRAISLIRQRDLVKGIPALEAVNRKYPNNEVVKLRLAEAYIQTRNFEKVHEVVAECLTIYPDYDKALNLKGVAYLQSGDFENAIETFRKIIRINYRFASAYHNLGLCYINMRPPEVEMALESFQKAIDVNAGYKPAYQAIASILHQMGRTQEANQYQSAADAL